MSMNKQKIKNLLSYSNSSFKGREEIKTDRYSKSNDSDLLQTIKTKISNYDETSKDKTIKGFEKLKLNNVTQSIDFNSYRMKCIDKSTLDSQSKFSKSNKENLSNFLYDEKSTTAGSKSYRDSFSLNHPLKNKQLDIYSNNVTSLKTKLLKEIAHFKNTLTNEIPATSNRPIAFSNHKEIKINIKDYFEFSPTKIREKGLVNANYFKSLREKQQTKENNQEKVYFKICNHINKNENEDSFEQFMRDFKEDKNKMNQFSVRYKNNK